MTAPTWSAIRDAAMANLLAIMETGQTVTADGRTLTFADIDKVRGVIRMADAEIARESRAGLARIVSVIPRA